jgi:hypothetical protein
MIEASHATSVVLRPLLLGPLPNGAITSKSPHTTSVASPRLRNAAARLSGGGGVHAGCPAHFHNR